MTFTSAMIAAILFGTCVFVCGLYLTRRQH